MLTYPENLSACSTRPVAKEGPFGVHVEDLLFNAPSSFCGSLQLQQQKFYTRIIWLLGSHF